MSRPRAWHVAALLLVVATRTTSAQLIPVRTIPMAQADQYTPFPSHNLGMGGVSIALADTLLDLSANPATGARLSGGRFFSSPVLYSVSHDAGAGGALPVGAVATQGSWFGGLALAVQVVSPGRSVSAPPLFFFQPGPGGVAPPPLEPNRSEGNQFAFALLGKSWPGVGVSAGASASWTRLNARDGVDMLYGGSPSVNQRGQAADYRLGILKEWRGGHALEAVAVRTRLRMTHDVTFVDFFYDPETQQVRGNARPEQNLDHQDTWGLHLAYRRPLGASGWRIGAVATANSVRFAEMPRFQVLDASSEAVPWDPGDAEAYQIGLGIARVTGPVRVGIDLIYEPIWSHTWVEALAPAVTRQGDTIPAGGVTVDNRFEFSNVLLRMGADRELSLGAVGNSLGLQMGLMVRANQYWLAQYDRVQAAGRNHREQWMEWTPTWGWSLKFPEFEIRYHGRVTNGTGRPGVFSGGGCGDCVFVADSPPQRFPSPLGTFGMGDVSVTSHQISISLPLGRRPAPGGVP